MLVKFRSNTVALTADIEKAFLMVGIRKEHRDMLRFLWFSNPSESTPEVVQYRFNRLVFGLRPSPSILGATIKFHLEQYRQSEPELVELIERSLYVDDLVTGEITVEKAYAIYERSKKVMSEGGFNLRKWKTNSRELRYKIAQDEAVNQGDTGQQSVGKIQEDDESYAKSTTGTVSSASKESVVKVLGLNWNIHTDEFYFECDELYDYAVSLPLSKRSVLKVTAKIFDPIGILTPFTIGMKVLFQELCVTKHDWDGELQSELLKKWKSFLSQLNHLGSIHIPRCYFLFVPREIQLYAFSDASKLAYAAVVYVRTVYENGQIDVRLVASKSRVSPLKSQSIPRLELLGALILARLVDSITRTGIKCTKETTFWTDSVTVLCWIKNTGSWKQYVQHRVDEICQLTDKELCRHCPGSLNPADLPSRGITASELASNSTWWNGPTFLLKPEFEWPQASNPNSNDLVLQEAVKNPPEITHSLVSVSVNKQFKNINRIIDVSRFGNIIRLLRVTALVLRIVSRLTRKNRKLIVENPENKASDYVRLNSADINEAETTWIKSIQASSFPKEIEFLSRDPKKSEHLTPPSYVTQFGLYFDNEGVIRCKGRINNASLPIPAKNPILLPSNHELVRLFIHESHCAVKHNGIKDTLTHLRERFWIVRGRESVKKFIRSCRVCRKAEGAPYNEVEFADLPSERVSEDPPFTHVGIDFAGPLYVLDELSKTKETVKVYILLFTCASTRAVHLELTRGLCVEAFLLAFRRFATRRGLPATLNSDNAKTFKSSSKDIRSITRSEEVWNYLTNRRITWSFIVEKAPWWGGYWERLIRSVKRPLKKILGRATLNFEQLRTILVEIEGVINARPITYVYDDQDSISYALTPSDMIYGRRVTTNPNSSHQEIVSTYQALTKRGRHQRLLLQHLTKRWRTEYLTELREHSIQKRNRQGSVAAISKGDVVILKNDSTNRAFWQLGKVEELVQGRDGKVRAAVVRVSRGEKQPIHLRRVIQQLIPIEVAPDTFEIET